MCCLRYSCASAVSGHPDERIPVLAELVERLYLILSIGEMLVVIESSRFQLSVSKSPFLPNQS
jgi:hypothetical protein